MRLGFRREPRFLFQTELFLVGGDREMVDVVDAEIDRQGRLGQVMFGKVSDGARGGVVIVPDESDAVLVKEDRVGGVVAGIGRDQRFGAGRDLAVGFADDDLDPGFRRRVGGVGRLNARKGLDRTSVV